VDGSGRAGELAKGVGQRGKHWLLDYKNGYLVLIFFFMSEFRFENLEIWKRSIEIDDLLFELSERAEKNRYYRYAEQLRAASMSISNNIAEGSGAFSNRDFANFLVFARRSVFECVNILTLFLKRKIINDKEKKECYKELETLSKMITNFRKYLLSN